MNQMFVSWLAVLVFVSFGSKNCVHREGTAPKALYGKDEDGDYSYFAEVVRYDVPHSDASIYFFEMVHLGPKSYFDVVKLYIDKFIENDSKRQGPAFGATILTEGVHCEPQDQNLLVPKSQNFIYSKAFQTALATQFPEKAVSEVLKSDEMLRTVLSSLPDEFRNGRCSDFNKGLVGNGQRVPQSGIEDDPFVLQREYLQPWFDQHEKVKVDNADLNLSSQPLYLQIYIYTLLNLLDYANQPKDPASELVSFWSAAFEQDIISARNDKLAQSIVKAIAQGFTAVFVPWGVKHRIDLEERYLKKFKKGAQAPFAFAKCKKIQNDNQARKDLSDIVSGCKKIENPLLWKRGDPM